MLIPYEIPIDSLTLPGVGELKAGGLVLVVGPNSSGKTQLLRDIFACVTGQSRELVVADKISLKKPKDLNRFLNGLVERGAVRKRDAGGTTTFESVVPHYGMGTGTSDATFRDIQTWYDGLVDELSRGLPRENPFFRQFGPVLSTSLFLDNRLAAVKGTNAFDHLSQKASNDIQALHLNSSARARLREEIRVTFGKAIGLDSTRGGHLSLRVSDLPEPSPWDWTSPERMSQLLSIDFEGDGLRSYCAVAIALLLGMRPLCLIDEPEICLHAPQAHAIGRFIGQYGTKDENATFVATHSSQVLRGVLETASDVRIVRLVKVGSRFVGRLVDQEVIRASLRKPASRSDVILEGIFADAVTIVEADTDRVVYNAALDVSQPPRRRDTYFAAVGGTGGIADPLQFYRALHIPVAVVADLDLILERVRLLRVLEMLTTKAAAQQLRNTSPELADLLSQVVPAITEGETATRLRELSDRKLSWKTADDETLAKDLRALANAVDRKKRVKLGGLGSFDHSPDVKKRLEAFVTECAGVGLFLVPVGELEGWSPSLMQGASLSDNKAEWANEFVRRLREHPDQAADIVAFVREVDSFHSTEAERLTTPSG